MPKILLTGASGGLGNYLLPVLSRSNLVQGVSRNASGSAFYVVDLTQSDRTLAMLIESSPEVIVHAAALTDVDSCQTSPDLAFSTNVETTRTIVEWIKNSSPKTKLVFISTDQVYGCHEGPHDESQVGPVNIYGCSKLWAEDLVRSLENHLIFRLNYVGLGTPKRLGLARWLVNSFLSRQYFNLFTDIRFNPLSGRQSAYLISDIIRRGLRGTFNLGAAGSGVTKAEFALRLASCLSLPTDRANPSQLSENGLLAPRPRDTRMKVDLIARHLPMPNIDSVIKSVADDFLVAGVHVDNV